MNDAQAQLLQMFAAQQGLDVGRVEASMRGGPAALARELAAAGRLDPAVASMVAEASAPTGERTTPDEITVLPPESPDPRRVTRSVRALGRRLRALEDELGAAVAMLDHVAGVLGACPSCFGCDAACSHCGGEGIPGAFRPTDPVLLSRWIRNLATRLSDTPAVRTANRIS